MLFARTTNERTTAPACLTACLTVQANSFTSSTPIPQSLVRKQLNRINGRCCGATRRSKRRREARRVQLIAADSWMQLLAKTHASADVAAVVDVDGDPDKIANQARLIQQRGYVAVDVDRKARASSSSSNNNNNNNGSAGRDGGGVAARGSRTVDRSTDDVEALWDMRDAEDAARRQPPRDPFGLQLQSSSSSSSSVKELIAGGSGAKMSHGQKTPPGGGDGDGNNGDGDGDGSESTHELWFTKCRVHVPRANQLYGGSQHTRGITQRLQRQITVAVTDAKFLPVLARFQKNVRRSIVRRQQLRALEFRAWCVGWLMGLLVCWLMGLLVCWLMGFVGLLVRWCVGWLVGVLVGVLVG